MVTTKEASLILDPRSPTERLRDGIYGFRMSAVKGVNWRSDFTPERVDSRQFLPHQFGFSLSTDPVTHLSLFELHVVPLLHGLELLPEVAMEIDNNLKGDGAKIVDILRRGIFVFQVGKVIREQEVERVLAPAWEPLLTIVSNEFPQHDVIVKI
jgi:hypothetical protein